MLGKCSTGVSSPSLHNYLCKVNPREKRVETDFFFFKPGTSESKAHKTHSPRLLYIDQPSKLSLPSASNNGTGTYGE